MNDRQVKGHSKTDFSKRNRKKKGKKKKREKNKLVEDTQRKNTWMKLVNRTALYILVIIINVYMDPSRYNSKNFPMCSKKKNYISLKLGFLKI